MTSKILSNFLGFVIISVSTKYSLAFLHQVRQSSSISRSLIKAAASSTSVENVGTPTSPQSDFSSKKKSIADFRKEYSQQGLLEEDIHVQGRNPFSLFQQWLGDAIQSKLPEPNAMCLSTCIENRPSARYVLLKGYDEKGFVWYTNYNSRKGNELTENPYAALTFLWLELERSVRIEGKVEKITEEESFEYFTSRPRGSQIGAWSSDQSQSINNREELENKEKKMIEKFNNNEIIPKPSHWGGYRLVPNRIEFWKGRQSRLHDRIVFERNSYDIHDNHWTITRLQP